MKFLIAGFGSIGRRHMRNLLTLGEKDIVLLRSQHSTLPVDELAGFPVETRLTDALAHRPDALIVANPTALHLDVAVPAAETGCSILMEKPVSDRLDGLDALRSALVTGGGRLHVGFQFRFHPGLQKAADLLADGAIGRPVAAQAHWGEYLPNWHPWEDYRNSYAARVDLGGGVINTLCHPLHYLGWLLGDIETLWAYKARVPELEIEVEAVAEMGLRFAGGATATLHLDYVQRPPRHDLEITGTQGTLQWDNASGATRLYRVSTESWETFALPAGFDRNDLFLAELRHFMAVTRGEVEPLCPLEVGERVVRLTQAAHRSAESGQRMRL